MVLERVPGETGLDVKHELLLREQSIGEMRGLKRLDRVVTIELETLRELAKENQ